ncbi:GbsR/MarR family transcriptional regulator [Pontibacter flavimaris]|uniref:HTH-type transcriptional regulator n=1 Tax=Pontibacter flavimaris TaxID=1797110 RepID=A0A1Q5PCV9_9BACT|nr:transcriptional regulator [Pontibacter flavimaris]OKL40011.1 transcriptional regulator [Pontibacter flavimaris]
MQLEEGKEKFIQAWGTLGSSWGINRTMAQVHALLLISPEALSTEDVMQELNVSRGNANMNLRALIDWGLISKELRPGERKEYFVAEKDMWKVAKQVIRERRKRELEPMLRILEELKQVEGNKAEKETQAFTEAIGNLHDLATKADKTLNTMLRADEHWFLSSFMKLMR